VNPRLDDIENLSRAIDRVVFADQSIVVDESEPLPYTLALISHLNDSFPRLGLSGARRQRMQRRIMRRLGLQPLQPQWLRLEGLETEVNRLRTAAPGWAPVVGGAIVLIGVLGIVVWRGRAGERIAAALR
jgi:hypothetical protein